MTTGPAQRPWRFDFAVAPEERVPRHVQLARALVREIQRGRLSPGQMLPGTRTLAANLKLNRKVVVAAIEELVSQGWLESEAARGTRVVETLPYMQVADAQGARPARMARPVAATTRFVLSDGIPDARLAPLDVIARAQRRALRSMGRAGLGYGDPAGDPELREVLSGFVNQARGLSCTPAQVLITRGSQMALSLLALTLLSPGDKIAVESPGYAPAWRAFELAGASVLHVQVDDYGIRTDALERLARKHEGRLRAVYVTPHHQYPTTVALSPERRMHLRSMARTFKFRIIEDDYDYEYHFDGSPLLPLSAAEAPGESIYVASLSKLLAPAVRLGYIVADEGLIGRLRSVRELLDRQGDVVLERAIAELIEDGELQRHARRARVAYRERRDRILELLRADAVLREVIDVRPPTGGLALWMRVTGLSVEMLAANASAKGLSLIPGSAHSHDGVIPAFRCGYGAFNTSELEQICAILAASVTPPSRSRNVRKRGRGV